VTSTVLGEAQKQGAVLAYGAFITVVINFLLVAFVLFQLVKISNRMKKAEPAPPPAGPTKSEELLAEIRDALRSKPSA
jgi:large conductance mechanosensitive channel